MIDHRQRIAQIHGDAILHDLTLVVGSLKQWFATRIAGAVNVRRSKTLVVGGLARLAHPAPREAIDEGRLRHIQVERRPHSGAEGRQALVECFGLRRCAGETIQ
jgi:hypothetical protein